jgi:sodium transport system ATP-binding protein
VIEVEALSKVYVAPGDGRPVVALHEASFKAQAGRCFGLLGANGAGKTTTLRILSTVLSPSSGRASIAGFDVQKQAPEVRARIGFLSGSTGVYERLSPREMLSYFGRLYGLDPNKTQSRSAELIDWLDMASFADRACGTLSTGQKQKTSIARALIHDPEVLIFDEPTSGLDILVARSVVEFIARLKAQGRTILLSTHIMSEAERLCDELAIIHGGRVLASGTVAELQATHGGQRIEDIFYALVDAAGTAPAEAS